MNVADFLADLRNRDIRVWREGGKVRCSAPAGALTTELRAQIELRKPEIIEFLLAVERISGQQPAIVPLQPKGERCPIYAIGGHNGDVFAYRQLVRHLGSGQPFFGLQPPGLDGTSTPLERVEDIAAYFADQIRGYRGTGPCIVAGFCAGGAIALELAHQLQRQGTAVRFIALFGCPYPTWFRLHTRWWWRYVDPIKHLGGHVRELARHGWAARREHILARLEARRAERRRQSSSDPVVAMRVRMERTTLAAVRRYVPVRFDGRVVAFLPSVEWVRESYGALDWRNLAQEVEEYWGPSGVSSDNMLHEPNAAVFARMLLHAAREGVIKSASLPA